MYEFGSLCLLVFVYSIGKKIIWLDDQGRSVSLIFYCFEKRYNVIQILYIYIYAGGLENTFKISHMGYCLREMVFFLNTFFCDQVLFSLVNHLLCVRFRQSSGFFIVHVHLKSPGDYSWILYWQGIDSTQLSQFL